MAMILMLACAAVSAMGTIASGNAAASAAQAQQQAMEFRAKQEEIAADESRASAQRTAMEHRREGRLAESQLQARAAASGGGATDPTVLNLGESIASRAEYGALMERYKGESKARGLEDMAVADRYAGQAALAEGEAKKKAATFSAFGTLLSGAGSAYSVYSGSSPLRTTSSGAFSYG